MSDPQAGAVPPDIYDAAEMLWVVLANVSGGDWTQQSHDLREAAARWRDNYFAAVAARSVVAPRHQNPMIHRLKDDARGYAALLSLLNVDSYDDAARTIKELQEPVAPRVPRETPDDKERER